MGDEGQALDLGLRDQHAIERVSVVRRKGRGAFGVRERDEELFEAAGEDTRFYRLRKLKASLGDLDRSLPG